MSETAQDEGTRPAAATDESRSYLDIIKSLVGASVTVVNPESYEAAPVGHQLKAGFYPAKVTAMGNDYLVVVTRYVRTGKQASKEPVKQYIPIGRIKRISVMKSERFIHL